MFVDEKKIGEVQIESQERQNLKKFIEALRSGKYRQTTEHIYKDGSYCAMGVAARSLGMRTRSATVYYKDWDGTFVSEEVLKDEVVQQLGLNSDQQHFIIKMNDEGKHTFKEIADYIESQFLPNVK